MVLLNDGEDPLTVASIEVDAERFCLEGFDLSQPVEIPILAPAESYSLILSVCDYLPGEQTLEVAGQIVFETDGYPSWSTLTWTYVPLRNQE